MTVSQARVRVRVLIHHVKRRLMTAVIHNNRQRHSELVNINEERNDNGYDWDDGYR